MSKKVEITVPADLKFLELVVTLVSKMAQLAGLKEKDVFNIELAVDEACTNVIMHAFEKDNSESYTVVCLIDDASFTIEVNDRGKFFDFDSVPEPEVQASIDDRKVGGLGIYLIRQIMDEVMFNQEPDGLKRLVMRKLIIKENP